MLNPDKELLLGKGKVFVDVLDDNGLSTGEVDLGNCTTFSLQPTVETTEKKTSMDKDGGTLAVISRTISVTLKIVGDYFNADNARLSGLCTEITETTPASTLTDAPLTASAVLGRFYVIPSKGTLSNIVIKSGATVITDAPSNYLFDARTNRILVVGGDIDAGDALTVSATVAARTRKVQAGATRKKVTALVRFVSDNTTGTNSEVVAHRVALLPDAETPFISDDLASWSVSGTILRSADVDPASPFYTVYSS
jgi:hypothetical protein